jgi:phosphomannomutase
MSPQPSAGELRFGSDGYRGVIGDNFCWEQVSRLTAGVVQYLRLRGVAGTQPIPIGYDTRFLAQLFARAVYLALESEGFTPKLATTFCPSPYLSFAVKRLGAPLGIMLTASHNPARYLGFKLKGPEGGSALPELNREVEQYAAEAKPDYDYEPAFASGECAQFDLRREYEETMRSYAGSGLGAYPFNLSVDFVRGTTAHLYLQVLKAIGVKFEPIHTELEELMGWVESGGPTSFGAAFDGDGDRLGLIDESGEFVPPEDIYAICLLHLVEDRGLRGRVIKSTSFSSLIDRICAALGLKLVEVPVGFKHSTRELMLPGTLMAAEESGGFGFGFHLPERDALLALLIVLSAMAARKSSLRSLREGITKRFGHPFFAREDIALASEEQVATVREGIARMKQEPELIGLEGARLSELDGVKLSFSEGFLLLRFSGTEPLLRIYCEHAVDGSEYALIKHVKDFLGLSQSTA